MTDDTGALTALRAERKLRKQAARDLDRTRTELAQARTEIRQLRVDLQVAQDSVKYWRRNANMRGKSLATANKTANLLAQALTKGIEE